MNLRRLLARWLGLIAVAIRQTASRATYTAKQRIQFSVLGVAVVIALLVMVTGLGVGIATSTTVADEDIDYWIVPETEGSSSPLVATDDPQFGSAHETNTQIRQKEEVESSTPVLSQIHQIEANGTSEFVLITGIINSPEVDRVSGLNSDLLTPNDPYYTSGEWTGEVVLSPSVAETLAVSPGDSITVADNSSFTVTAIDEQSGTSGGIPSALVQLSEFQAVTGSASYDQADQFVVGTNSPSVEEDLADVYPESTVNSRGEMMASNTQNSELSLSLALTAFVVSLSIGTLFVVTTSGLEIVTDRQQLTILSVMGVSVRSQLQLIGTQTLVMTGLGGIIGSIGGLAGIRLINAIAVRTVTTEPIAVSRPLFLGYGLGVALLIGLLSLPVLLLVARRVSGGVPQ
ncbi:ABC transporter permease [Natronococcus sp. JC468]|uniref:ABC transporter permease n=1 Tax=Natronococcus sp. JC468 TaxID=1961921 RepID=UPI00143B4B8D|nr:ABC transporter permease [Natronococcus sp. JC468]NKE37480.1 ABC transporter permease [Natronococcus sp. JC468]